MHRIALLENPTRAYAWGSRVAIARLLGAATPSPEPEAELWMGAHPSGSSWLEMDGERASLADLVSRAPEAVLGRRVLARFGPQLPFLVKLIAVGAPLSIQVHPSEAQARAGFARENALEIPLDAGERSYRDAGHKPELICALEPFEALVGFRPPAEISEVAGRLGTPELVELVEAALARAHPLEALFRSLLGLDPSRCDPLLSRVSSDAAGAADPALAWVVRLAALHPGDPGALAPLFLNHRRLSPRDALFLPPGELHSYLSGFGIEVMASSDNVLRGGLTGKHVDREELLRVVRFEPSPAAIRAPEPAAGGLEVYRAPATEFELSLLRVAPSRSFRFPDERGVEILLCARGRVRVHAASGGVELRSGHSCIAPAAAGAYAVEGEGDAYRVAVPSAGPAA